MPRQDVTMEFVQSSRGLERAPGPGRGGAAPSAEEVLEVAVLGVAPIVATAVVLGLAIGDDAAFDFRQFWQGGRDVAHGVSPYPEPGPLPESPRRPSSTEGIQETQVPLPRPHGARPRTARRPFLALAATIFTLLLLAVTRRRSSSSGSAIGAATERPASRSSRSAPCVLGRSRPCCSSGRVAWRYATGLESSCPCSPPWSASSSSWPLVVWLAATGRAAERGCDARGRCRRHRGRVDGARVLRIPRLPGPAEPAHGRRPGKSYSATASAWPRAHASSRSPQVRSSCGSRRTGLTFVVAERVRARSPTASGHVALVASLLLTPDPVAPLLPPPLPGRSLSSTSGSRRSGSCRSLAHSVSGEWRGGLAARSPGSSWRWSLRPQPGSARLPARTRWPRTGSCSRSSSWAADT